MRLIISALLVLGMLRNTVEASNQVQSADTKIARVRFLRASSGNVERTFTLCWFSLVELSWRCIIVTRTGWFSSIPTTFKNKEVVKAKKLIADRASLKKILDIEVESEYLRKALGLTKDFGITRFTSLCREKHEKLIVVIKRKRLNDFGIPNAAPVQVKH
ncbi:hypothetical protein PHMEG_0004769, partial [Phytophthora megakarya]